MVTPFTENEYYPLASKYFFSAYWIPKISAKLTHPSPSFAHTWIDFHRLYDIFQPAPDKKLTKK
jgi:hypothetical protein